MAFSHCLVLFSSFFCLLALLSPVAPHDHSCADRPTCDASKAICESDNECKKLLDDFTSACRRAIHHGHRKHCHEKCANALDNLLGHSQGEALATCSCGGDKNCENQRHYLKKACTRRHGERNCSDGKCSDISCFVSYNGHHSPPPKKNCSVAIAHCLLDSCCRKAYLEFYYGTECRRVHQGYSSEPSCSDACVEKFDSLAMLPHADDLFSCDCADLGEVCIKRYENYDKFCVDGRLRSLKRGGDEGTLPANPFCANAKSSSSDAVTSTSSTLCSKALARCICDEQCGVAMDQFFGECHHSLVYIGDGPPPVCPSTCKEKSEKLFRNPYGKDLKSCDCGSDTSDCFASLRKNMDKYCQSPTPQIPDCATASAGCVEDPECNRVLRAYLFGNECKNVLTHTEGSNSTKPICSSSCIEKERELRKQPKAKPMLYCNCGSVGQLCSAQRNNFNKYCNTCPEDYTDLIGDGAISSKLEQINDCGLALNVCIANEICSKAYTAFYSGTACRSVLFHTEGQPEPICTDECIALEKALRKIPEARSLVTDCKCNMLGEACKRPRENFQRFCLKDCAHERAECKLDPICNTIFNNFLHGTPCNNVLYANEDTAATCSNECKAHGERVFNVKAHDLLKCKCNKLDQSCCSTKQNFFKHCNIPASTPGSQDSSCSATMPDTSSPSSPPLCALAISKCQANTECNQLLDNFLHGDDCKNVLYHTGDGDDPICFPSCLVRHVELISHPVGKDLLQCDCSSLGSVCSAPFKNLYMFCTIVGSGQQISGDYCEVHAQRCLQNSSCRLLFKKVTIGSNCYAITTHAQSGQTTLVDCSGCTPDLDELKSHSHGVDMFGCTCSSLNCKRAQSVFNQVCGLLPLCSDIRTACSKDAECQKLFDDFTRGPGSCYHILFPSDPSNILPNCTLACLLAHSRLLSHPTAKQMVSCNCGNNVATCSLPRSTFLKHCPVPDSTLYPTGVGADSKCEARVHRCLSQPSCSSRFAFDSIACDMVVNSTDAATIKPLCDRCILHMTRLAAEPDGLDINACPCETDICQHYQDKIRQHCLQRETQTEE
ncbi:uncharacterized protein LOC134192057 [Corticium candelabrum]|uniref:uncharacterized protein LOC134192057 n=1 Tax=Corticium candelabrum TaxID=121492 RepID=UPI002E272399|nr:uncharacterized protein LOC134192057 [Corticium candelabrum]